MEYQFSNITPGVYTFGVAPLTGVPAQFDKIPFVHPQKNNEGEPFLQQVTTTGFTLIDRYLGPPPVVTITIIEQA